MRTVLFVIQIIISVSLIILILIQSKGAGIGTAFGGEASFYRSRRGIEKLFVYLTIVFAALFFLISLIQILV